MKNISFPLLIAICGFFFLSFSVENPNNCEEAKKELVAKFTDFLHMDIYGVSEESDSNEYDIIWAKPGNQCAIISIINDTSLKLKVRFFAAEILLQEKDTIPAEIKPDVLARIYADAIARNAFGTLNYFGMFSVSSTGYSGKNLLKIGKMALPYLAKLLDNNTGMHYWGSKTADAGNAWLYRSKDVAAFYIFHLRNETFSWPYSPEARDKIITRLKKTLKAK